MLTLGVLGIRLALGAQTEREGVKLRPTLPQPHPGTRCHCFPGFPYFIPIFSRLLHHHIPTQALPKLSARHPGPHPALLCSRVSCKPIHPHLESWIKHLQAPWLRTQAAAPRLLRMLFPQSFSLLRMGRSPRASLAVLGGQHPLSPTSGGCPGGDFGVRGGWLGRAGLARGLGSLLADGHRLWQHLLGQTLEEPGTGAFPHLWEQSQGSWRMCDPTSPPCSPS